MHPIHASRIGRAPWGWRDGLVTTLEGLWVSIEYVNCPGSARIWHHEPLTTEIQIGAAVRLHEDHHALGGPFGWINVVVAEGAGPVPTPPDTSSWAPETIVAVTDLSTGRALAMDHHASNDDRSAGSDHQR